MPGAGEVNAVKVGGSRTWVAPARPCSSPAQPRARDLQQTLRLVLATVWLMDAALQLQPYFFTPGTAGFAGMLRASSSGTPAWIAHTITWNASVVGHRAGLANTAFVGVQLAIAFGMAWKRTVRLALALSMAWAVAVWWFAEGLGGVFAGAATPLAGGPGAVLFYALLAVLLWPSEGSNAPFVAARTVGPPVAKAVWAAVWLLLGVLAVVGQGRSPQHLHDVVAGLRGGEPGWLAALDRWTSSVLWHDGGPVAVAFAAFCILVALSVWLDPRLGRVVLAGALVVFAFVWVGVENVGGVLAGRATDPNSGLLVMLFVLAYWPLTAAWDAGSRRATMVLGRGSGRAGED